MPEEQHRRLGPGAGAEPAKESVEGGRSKVGEQAGTFL